MTATDDKDRHVTNHPHPFDPIAAAVRNCPEWEVKTWNYDLDDKTHNPLIRVERLRGKSLLYREQLEQPQMSLLKKYLDAIEDACDTAHDVLCRRYVEADRWCEELIAYERAEYAKECALRAQGKVRVYEGATNASDYQVCPDGEGFVLRYRSPDKTPNHPWQEIGGAETSRLRRWRSRIPVISY